MANESDLALWNYFRRARHADSVPWELRQFAILYMDSPAGFQKLLKPSALAIMHDYREKNG